MFPRALTENMQWNIHLIIPGHVFAFCSHPGAQAWTFVDEGVSFRLAGSWLFRLKNKGPTLPVIQLWTWPLHFGASFNSDLCRLHHSGALFFSLQLWPHEREPHLHIMNDLMRCIISVWEVTLTKWREGPFLLVTYSICWHCLMLFHDRPSH